MQAETKLAVFFSDIALEKSNSSYSKVAFHININFSTCILPEGAQEERLLELGEETVEEDMD
jgi:hypothetical protein